mgnify:CR=1 FL=1
MPDLSALVERCRTADAELETAREYGDSDDRNGAINERDAAYRRLGAEWAAIGELLAAAPAVPIGRDRTGGKE